MSIIFENEEGGYLCHKSMYDEIYSDLGHEYEFVPEYFEINKPFKCKKKFDVSKVFSGNDTEEESTIRDVEASFETFVKKLNTRNVSTSDCSSKSVAANAKSLAAAFYQNQGDKSERFKGYNSLNCSVITNVNLISYIIPKCCKFFCYDVKEIAQHIDGEKFDFILLDPPWWNKYIRRKRKHNSSDGYIMMYNNDVADIPISTLLSDEGLVAVWCTNSKANIESVLNEIFPSWNLKFVSQWFWVKITTNGEPVCPFSKPGRKQPFERIIFGCQNVTNRQYPLPQDKKLILSVPSAIHSHKPPLCNILQKYLPENPKCLEIFARYLLPHWTSYGNEVLKLQNLSLFKKVT